MSRALFPLQHAHDEDVGAGRPELLAHRRRGRLGPGHVLGPVQDDQRALAHDLEPAGRADRGRRRGHDVGLEGPPEEGLRPHQGGHEVVGLVAAVEGKVNVLVAGARRAQVDKPSAHRHDVGLDGEIAAGQPQGVGILGGEDVVEVRIGLAQHQGAPGLTMPAFSRAMCSRVGPSSSVWSRATLVTIETVPSTTLVASQRPPIPTSMTVASTGRLAKYPKAAAAMSSNQVGRSPSPSSGSRAASSLRTSARSISLIGDRSTMMRSLIFSRCGLIKVPTRRAL